MCRGCRRHVDQQPVAQAAEEACWFRSFSMWTKLCLGHIERLGEANVFAPDCMCSLALARSLPPTDYSRMDYGLIINSETVMETDYRSDEFLRRAGL